MQTVAELEAARDEINAKIALKKKLEKLEKGEIINVHFFSEHGGPPTTFMFKEPGPVEELKTVIRDLLKDETR